MLKLKDHIARLQKELSLDAEDRRAICISTFAVLCLVGLVMTVMNIFTHKGFLTIATAVFAGCCLLNILLAMFGKKPGLRVALVLFSAEIVALFTYFLVWGSPEGFSSIWICMLPSLGLFFFGRGRGSVLCGIMLCVMVFFLWIPFGEDLLQHSYYTGSFKMRFPVLYLAFFVLAFFLESIRVHAFNEADRMQNMYKELAARDQLTGMYNRQGMYAALENGKEYTSFHTLGAVMIDIDYFKRINDTYGHNAGDAVLKEISKMILEELDAVICRWGGEEFVVIYVEEKVRRTDLEALRSRIASHSFIFGDVEIKTTVSIGVCEVREFDIHDVDRLIGRADQALYRAKNSGRNRVLYVPSTEAE